MQTKPSTTDVAQETIPYLNKLLELCGGFPLPPDTNAGNLIDMLKTLFSQINGSEAKTEQEKITEALGIDSETMSLSDRARVRTHANRQVERQRIARDIAQRRRISYFDALKFVPE